MYSEKHSFSYACTFMKYNYIYIYLIPLLSLMNLNYEFHTTNLSLLLLKLMRPFYFPAMLIYSIKTKTVICLFTNTNHTIWR